MGILVTTDEFGRTETLTLEEYQEKKKHYKSGRIGCFSLVVLALLALFLFLIARA